MEVSIHTLAELEAEAERFTEKLILRRDSAILVTLSGELGAGKTAFVKAVAKALGVEDTVTSPTFVLEKIYALPQKQGFTKPPFERLVHIDAYRLTSGAELATLGFDEIMRNPANLVLLEWPERVADALPEPSVRLALACVADGTHTIAYGH